MTRQALAAIVISAVRWLGCARAADNVVDVGERATAASFGMFSRISLQVIQLRDRTQYNLCCGGGSVECSARLGRRVVPYTSREPDVTSNHIKLQPDTQTQDQDTFSVVRQNEKHSKRKRREVECARRWSVSNAQRGSHVSCFLQSLHKTNV